MERTVEEQGFNQLVDGLKQNLKKICVKSRFLEFIDKDDLYQEALISLWDKFHNGQLQDKTPSYIVRGCYFHIQNYIRTHKIAAHTVSLEEPVAAEEDGAFCLKDIIEDESGNFFDRLNCSLIVRDIINNGLSLREKGVFKLLHAGLTIREIARELGISHVRVIKIKQNINRKYAPYYKEHL